MKNPLDAKKPGDLFSSPSTARDEYLALTKRWHPDRPNGDANVMAHINALYAQIGSSSTWTGAQSGLVMNLVGGTIRYRYIWDQSFELGHLYYAKKSIVYMVDMKYKTLVDNYIASIGKIKYPDKKFEKELANRFSPKPTGHQNLVDGSEIELAFAKGEDQILLRHLLPNINKDPRHIAWILNRLYDLLCTLHLGGLSHNNLSVDSIFLSPSNHTAHLYGWWYAATIGAPISFLPRIAHAVTPPDVLVTKRASQLIDLAMIKVLGRELAGDRTGMTLAKSPTNNFLRAPTSGSTVEDYQGWSNALTAEFGPKRQFHELVV